MGRVRWTMCGASLARCTGVGIPRMDGVARDLGHEVAVDALPAGWAAEGGTVVAWGHRKFVTSMVRACAAGPAVAPWHDPAPVSFSRVGERFRRHLLFPEFVIAPLRDVPGLDADHDLLLRPEAGSRVWPAVGIARGSLSLGVAAHPKLGLIPQDTPCMVARARDLVEEHRCVIVGGRVTSASRHRLGKHLRVSGDVPRAVRAVAEAVAAEPLQPMGAYVVDVGTTAEGEVGAIGFGPFSTAELNAVDPVPMVRAVGELFLAPDATRAA